MLYHVEVNGSRVSVETSLASAKSVVTGLKADWIIWHNDIEHKATGIISSEYSGVSAFFTNTIESKKFLKKFKKCRVRPDVGNNVKRVGKNWVIVGTDYIVKDVKPHISKLDKTLVLMGF